MGDDNNITAGCVYINPRIYMGIMIETSVDDAFKWTEIPVLMFARDRGFCVGVVHQIRT